MYNFTLTFLAWVRWYKSSHRRIFVNQTPTFISKFCCKDDSLVAPSQSGSDFMKHSKDGLNTHTTVGEPPVQQYYLNCLQITRMAKMFTMTPVLVIYSYSHVGMTMWCNISSTSCVRSERCVFIYLLKVNVTLYSSP